MLMLTLPSLVFVTLSSAAVSSVASSFVGHAPRRDTHLKRATQTQLSEQQAQAIHQRLAQNSTDSWVSGTCVFLLARCLTQTFRSREMLTAGLPTAALKPFWSFTRLN